MAILLLLIGAALVSRIYTTNSLAGEPTSDEYLYAIDAREMARSLSSGHGLPAPTLSGDSSLITQESAVLATVIPWDPLTLGRTLQALLNALCIPMLFLFARATGLRRAPGVAGALLLMAVPEFQESAWRFWSDSQATLLGLCFLTTISIYVRRASIPSGIGALACLALLFATKTSAAATFSPFVVLLAAPAIRIIPSARGRKIAVAAVAGLVLAFAWLTLRSGGLLQIAAAHGIFSKIAGYAPLIEQSVRLTPAHFGAYVANVQEQLGPAQLSIAVTWAIVLGYLVVLGSTVVAALDRRAAALGGWLGCALAWLPAGLLLAWEAVGSHPAGSTIVLASAAVLVAMATVAVALERRPSDPWGVLLAGAVVLAFVVERLLISAAPKLGTGAALTFRSFMPVIPLLALLGGVGIWGAAAAWRLLSRAASGQVLVAACATLFLLVAWTPLRDRASATPLLGRASDRGADPNAPMGLRVDDLVEAQPWLLENIQPSDRTVTGLPRELAWYADLGPSGLNHLVDLGSQPRTPAERLDYIQELTGPSGVDYVVDFNLNWWRPDSPDSKGWQQTLVWLSQQPNIQIAYLKRDKFGNPVFYVARNLGYAGKPTTTPAG